MFEQLYKLKALSDCFYLLNKSEIGDLIYLREKIQQNVSLLNDDLSFLNFSIDNFRERYIDNLKKEYELDNEYIKWKEEILLIKEIINKRKRIEFLNQSLDNDLSVLILIDLFIDKFKGS
jgi:hypothetical protein